VSAVIDLFSRRVVGCSIERFYNAIRRHTTIGYVSPVEF